jgi:hypothetical protein
MQPGSHTSNGRWSGAKEEIVRRPKKLSDAWRALGEYVERQGFEGKVHPTDVFLCPLLRREELGLSPLRRKQIQAEIDLFLDTNEESRLSLFLDDFDFDNDGGGGIRALFCYNMAALEKSLGR